MHPTGQPLQYSLQSQNTLQSQHSSQSHSNPFAVGGQAYSGGSDMSGANISSDYPSPGSAKSGSLSNSKSQLEDAYDNAYATRHA